jgi:hypothetical protein
VPGRMAGAAALTALLGWLGLATAWRDRGPPIGRGCWDGRRCCVQTCQDGDCHRPCDEWAWGAACHGAACAAEELEVAAEEILICAVEPMV